MKEAYGRLRGGIFLMLYIDRTAFYDCPFRVGIQDSNFEHADLITMRTDLPLSISGPNERDVRSEVTTLCHLSGVVIPAAESNGKFLLLRAPWWTGTYDTMCPLSCSFLDDIFFRAVITDSSIAIALTVSAWNSVTPVRFGCPSVRARGTFELPTFMASIPRAPKPRAAIVPPIIVAIISIPPFFPPPLPRASSAKKSPLTPGSRDHPRFSYLTET